MRPSSGGSQGSKQPAMGDLGGRVHFAATGTVLSSFSLLSSTAWNVGVLFFHKKFRISLSSCTEKCPWKFNWDLYQL